MFHHKTNLAIFLITIVIFYSATAQQNNHNCQRRCGEQSVKYPFGFSDGCKVKLNCTNSGEVKIGELQVQEVNSDSIFISLPTKCNRSVNFIDPLFGNNFAPTWNNSFLVQRCESKLGGCVISTSTFIGTHEGCDIRSENITCFTQLQRLRQHEDVLTLGDWEGIKCEFLFSAIAVDRSLRFESVELGWWHEGTCQCSVDANCLKVGLARGRRGFRCRCREGFVGDGFVNGSGCRRVNNFVSKWRIWLIVGAAVAVLVFSVAVPVFCYYKGEVDRKRKRKKLMAEVGGNAMGNYGKAKKTTIDGIQVFNFETLIAATKNFSLDNKLGEGGFGLVYQGELIDGQEIAIKRLSRSSGQGLLEFKNEATIMAKLQHTNLVRLLGFCIERDERILIYEYMSNKSLDFYLFDASRKNVLDWKKRLNIIEGIAQGLVYLHRYSRVKVIHRDLKPSNVLLDEGMNPKISDFGMARIFGLKGPQENTNRVVGTYGYMSPEYAISGVVSVKTDVYSFGVLLLEIISGMKNNILIHSNQPFNLMGHAWQLWNKGRALELIDPSLNESHNSVEVLRCIHIGLLCVQDHAADRPTIQDVVSFLSNYAIQLGQPKQPAFFVSGVQEESGLPNSRQESYSLNGVSISTVYGR